MMHEPFHFPKYNRVFATGILLNTGYIIAEASFGIAVGSMALLADAGHNLTDVLGLSLAWAASRLVLAEPTRHRTYGFRSSTIMAALLNALIVMGAVGGIAWEAIRRLRQPLPVHADVVMWVAGAGILVNAATAWMLMSGSRTDLNFRGAFVHMAADAVVSLGVLLAGFAIRTTGWLWIDPAMSLVIAGVITLVTWELLRDSLNLAMHAVPKGIDPEAIENYLSRLPGIVDVHDLHIWGMSTTQTALTAHLVEPEPKSDDALISEISRVLQENFGIEHATLQMEHGAAFCTACPSSKRPKQQPSFPKQEGASS